MDQNQASNPPQGKTQEAAEDDFLAGITPQENACPLDGSCESCQ
ncbi:hypothetical protein BSFA1_81330 (plasmid) [Burkholderia sp. SFA1]|nr:hypothetical protein BSFA1_81330 [Burkholderia sp. SFA1]